MAEHRGLDDENRYERETREAQFQKILREKAQVRRMLPWVLGGLFGLAVVVFIATGSYRKDNTTVVKPGNAPVTAASSLSGTADMPVAKGAPEPMGDTSGEASEPAFSAGPESKGSSSSGASASGVSDALTEGNTQTRDNAVTQGKAVTQGRIGTPNTSLSGVTESASPAPASFSGVRGAPTLGNAAAGTTNAPGTSSSGVGASGTDAGAPTLGSSAETTAIGGGAANGVGTGSSGAGAAGAGGGQ